MGSIRRIGATLVVIGALGIAADTASAEEFSILANTFKVTWRALTFHYEGMAETVSCPVTMQGRFSVSTFAPVSRTRIATVERVSVGSCTGGTVRVLSETLPWTLQYDSFGGTLPNITSMTTRLVGASFSITIRPFTCLLRSSESEPLKLRFNRNEPGELPEVTAVEASRISLSGASCERFSTGYVAGTAEDSMVETEGEPLLYLNGRGNALGTENLTGLVTVSIAAGGTANLTMINRLRGELVTITSGPTSQNTAKFTIEATGTTCGSSVTMLSLNGATSCTIRIRRQAGAVAGDTVPIEIRYYSAISFPIPVEQNFIARAT